MAGSAGSSEARSVQTGSCFGDSLLRAKLTNVAHLCTWSPVDTGSKARPPERSRHPAEAPDEGLTACRRVALSYLRSAKLLKRPGRKHCRHYYLRQLLLPDHDSGNRRNPSRLTTSAPLHTAATQQRLTISCLFCQIFDIARRNLVLDGS